MDLAGSRVLVTGASGGLGGAACACFSAAGAEVLASGRDRERLAAATAAERLPADLTVAAERRQLAAAVGQIDGFLHCAGSGTVAPLRYLADRDAEAALAANTAAPLLLTRELLKAKAFNRGASIVWLSSVAAHRASAGYSVYAASKAALEAAARCLALECAGPGIRVNCIAPGWVETGLTRSAGDGLPDGAVESHLQRYPLGPGSPEDVAEAARFLLSRSARWITGTVLTVDGGYSAG